MPSTVASSTRVLRPFSILALSMLAAACSTAPKTLGDHALEHGKKWNRGTEMVEDGQDLIKKGNRQIENGNEEIAEGKLKISKGNNLISQGQALVTEAETALRAQQLPPPGQQPPVQ